MTRKWRFQFEVLSRISSSDTVFTQANLIDLQKQLKNVSFRKVPPSKNPEAVSEYEVEDHELPTFLFIEVKICQYSRMQHKNSIQDMIEMDKLATGLSYQQLNGGGVTTEKLGNQIRIVFRM